MKLKSKVTSSAIPNEKKDSTKMDRGERRRKGRQEKGWRGLLPTSPLESTENFRI